MSALHIFDFDQTLFKSPSPPVWWSSKKHGFWWNLVPSLGRPFIPDNGAGYWKEDVVREAKMSISDRGTWAVVCTGRPDIPSMAYRVAELLKDKGLDFNEVFLKPENMDTADFKARKVFALIQKHGFQSVEMWDDDADNLRAVEKVCVRVGVPFVAHKETAREESAEGSEEAYNELIKTWGKTANQAFKITEGALKRYFTTGRPRSVFVTLEDGSPVDITSLRYEREANLLLKGYFSSDPSDQEEVYAHINHLGQIGQGWIY